MIGRVYIRRGKSAWFVMNTYIAGSENKRVGRCRVDRSESHLLVSITSAIHGVEEASSNTFSHQGRQRHVLQRV